MLTAGDLSQIRKILREEIEAESETTRSELRAEIKLTKVELANRLNAVADKLKDHGISLNKIQKDLKIIVNYFDSEEIKVQRRLKRIEQHLNLPVVN